MWLESKIAEHSVTAKIDFSDAVATLTITVELMHDEYYYHKDAERLLAGDMTPWNQHIRPEPEFPMPVIKTNHDSCKLQESGGN